MERILALALMEALHKRLAYLRGDEVVRLSDYIRRNGLSASGVANAPRRQTVPAFREKGPECPDAFVGVYRGVHTVRLWGGAEKRLAGRSRAPLDTRRSKQRRYSG